MTFNMGKKSDLKAESLNLSGGRKNEIKLNFESGKKKLTRGSSGLGVSPNVSTTNNQNYTVPQGSMQPIIRKSNSQKNMSAAKKKNKIKFKDGNTSDSNSQDSNNPKNKK